MTRKHTLKIHGKRMGFTMIEILVVASLLSVLSVGGYAAYSNQIALSRDARRKTDIKKLSSALMDYFNDHQVYPDNSVVTNCDSTDLAPYISTIPCDPINKGSYKYDYEPNQFYNYFTLSAKMERDSLGTYQITSDGSAGAVNNEEGEPPTCGGTNKYCFATVCGSCCPGQGYRCSGSGQRCIVDPSCNNH